MENNQLQLPDSISVRTLAGLINKPPTELITKLITNGVMAHINQEIDYDTAALLVEEFGFTAEPQVQTKTIIPKSIESKSAVSRPPIITIMGHVDHGKTSLLDHIRSSDVAGHESGGITQHISSYQIDFKAKDARVHKLTFIDTPGHEAFSALRAHGASITDLVILVVAADDGVKPQTVEALDHAKTANVPVIVALNKIDLPGANIEKVKKQLVELELTPEDWGGKTITVGVSAKTGVGVSDLLEMVVLTTELMELRADPDGQPEGIVLEGLLDKQIGPVATVLVYNGTIRPGQVIVAGSTYGRIRAMENDRHDKVVAAGPAMPVRIVGLKEVPQFGDRITVVPNEKVARTLTLASGSGKARLTEDKATTLNVILKADVGGSLAALQESVSKLKHNDAVAQIISSGIGELTENDIKLAKPAKAAIIVFRSRPAKRLLDLAEKDEVVVKEFWVIYEALDFISERLKAIATPTFITTELGRLKVLAVFSQKDREAIVGGEVIDGHAQANTEVIITRQKEEIGRAKLSTIKIGKVESPTVEKGQQCGLSLTEAPVVEVGDIVTFITTRPT
jgi:translation initiation factor IF-2